jgi:hypothetical protein
MHQFASAAAGVTKLSMRAMGVLAFALAVALCGTAAAAELGHAPKEARTRDELVQTFGKSIMFGPVNRAEFLDEGSQLFVTWYCPFSGRSACYLHAYYYDADKLKWLLFANELIEMEGPPGLEAELRGHELYVRNPLGVTVLMRNVRDLPRLVTSAGAQGADRCQKAARPLMDDHRSWKTMYTYAGRLPDGCFDGPVAERISNNVVRKLAHDWPGFMRVASRHQDDTRFVAFILKAISAVSEAADVSAIVTLSADSCAPGLAETCRAIGTRAEQARKVQGSARGVK